MRATVSMHNYCMCDAVLWVHLDGRPDYPKPILDPLPTPLDTQVQFLLDNGATKSLKIQNMSNKTPEQLTNKLYILCVCVMLRIVLSMLLFCNRSYLSISYVIIIMLQCQNLVIDIYASSPRNTYRGQVLD